MYNSVSLFYFIFFKNQRTIAVILLKTTTAQSRPGHFKALKPPPALWASLSGQWSVTPNHMHNYLSCAYNTTALLLFWKALHFYYLCIQAHAYICACVGRDRWHLPATAGALKMSFHIKKKTSWFKMLLNISLQKSKVKPCAQFVEQRLMCPRCKKSEAPVHDRTQGDRQEFVWWRAYKGVGSFAGQATNRTRLFCKTLYIQRCSCQHELCPISLNC